MLDDRCWTLVPVSRIQHPESSSRKGPRTPTTFGRTRCSTCSDEVTVRRMRHFVRRYYRNARRTRRSRIDRSPATCLPACPADRPLAGTMINACQSAHFNTMCRAVGRRRSNSGTPGPGREGGRRWSAFSPSSPTIGRPTGPARPSSRRSDSAVPSESRRPRRPDPCPARGSGWPRSTGRRPPSCRPGSSLA